MTNFQQAREMMVDCQIRPNDVTDYDVLEAFLTVPREEFVPSHKRALAYIDEDICVKSAEDDAKPRYLMEPFPFARLVQLAEIKADDVVLDVGCATGYSTAILSQLCSFVVGLENDNELAQYAIRKLAELECDNAVIVEGSLEAGYPEQGPYDVIIVSGAVGLVPDTLADNIKEGGRLVAVEGGGNAAVARLYTRRDGVVSAHTAFNCAVKPLPGFEKQDTFVF